MIEIVLAGLLAGVCAVIGHVAGRLTAQPIRFRLTLVNDGEIAKITKITRAAKPDKPNTDVAERLARGDYTPAELADWSAKGVIGFRKASARR